MIRSVLGIFALGLTVGAAHAADLRYGYEYGAPPPPPEPRYGYEEQAPLPPAGPRYGFDRHGPDFDRPRYARPLRPPAAIEEDENETDFAEAPPLPSPRRPSCFERRTPWGSEEICR